jgi:hypothetical protein
MVHSARTRAQLLHHEQERRVAAAAQLRPRLSQLQARGQKWLSSSVSSQLKIIHLWPHGSIRLIILCFCFASTFKKCFLCFCLASAF